MLLLPLCCRKSRLGRFLRVGDSYREVVQRRIGKAEGGIRGSAPLVEGRRRSCGMGVRVGGTKEEGGGTEGGSIKGGGNHYRVDGRVRRWGANAGGC